MRVAGMSGFTLRRSINDVNLTLIRRSQYFKSIRLERQQQALGMFAYRIQSDESEDEAFLSPLDVQ
jgi:hypothetical protein